LIFYIRDGFEYEFGVGTHILVTRPVPVFWNWEKLKLISKPSQSGKYPSKWVWFGPVPTGMSFVVMLHMSLFKRRGQKWK